MNHVTVSGVVESIEHQVKSGSAYGKIRLTLTNKKTNRIDLVEIIGKTDDISEFVSGDYLVVHGSVSGKENDRGYINMSIYGMGYEVLGNGTANQYNNTTSRGGGRRPSQDELSEDAPF